MLKAEWSVEQLFSEALNDLQEQMGKAVEKDGVYRWRRSNRISENIFKLDRADGVLEMEVSAPEYLKYLIAVFAVVSLTGLLSGYQLFVEFGAVGSAALYLVFNSLVEVPRAEGFEITSIRTAPVYFVSLGVAFFAVLPSQYSSNGVLRIVYVVAVLYILGQHFAEGSLPIQSKYVPKPGQSQSFLLIPMLGLAAPIGSYVLFNVFAFLRQLPIPMWSVVVSVAAAAFVGLWFYGVLCREAIWKIRRDRNKAFDSKPIQVFSLLLYLVLNAVSLVILVFFIDIVSIGLRGEAVVQNLSESGLELFTEVYSNLDAVFEILPVLSSRTGSILFFIVVFLPTLFLSVLWLLHLTLNLSYKLYLYWTAQLVEIDVEDAEGISIVSVDSGSAVIKPVSTFFGLKQMIVVDRSVLESLDRESGELHAVLAHEVYHLRKREAVLNVFSTVLAFGFIGGKNAVLSFYNYPKIEEEADQYAVERYGVEALQTALRKLKPLKSKKIDNLLTASTISYPGIIRKTESEDVDADMNKKEDSLVRRIRGVLKDFAAPYQLFYGSILFDESHQSLDDRIDRVG